MIFTHILRYGITSITLGNDPVGWNDVQLRLERDRERHGITENIDVTLSFRCLDAGREFVENAIGNGIDEIVSIDVYLDCGDGNELFYQGTLKLAEAEFTEDFLTVPVEQVSVQRTFDSRTATDLDINARIGVDGQVLPNLPMLPTEFEYHSRAIKMVVDLGLGNMLNTDINFLFDGISPPATSQPASTTWTVRIQPPITIIDPTFPGFQSTPSFHQNGADLTAGSGNILINWSANLGANQFIEDGFINLIWNVQGTYTDLFGTQSVIVNDVGMVLFVGETIEDAAQIALGVINMSATAPSTGVINMVGNQNIAIRQSDKIWINFSGTRQITAGSLANSNIVRMNFTAFDMRFETDSVGDPSQGQAFPVYESAARLVAGLCGANITSNFFGRTNSTPKTYPSNGCGAYTVIANGYQIRNVTDAAMYINWDTFFKTLQSIFNVGWGWEGNIIRIESADYFYNDTLILDLDDANAITDRVAAEFYTQKIEVGFEEWETNDLFIADETQTRRQFVTRIKSVDNSIDAIAPYITSSYAIEVTRRLGGNDTYRDYNEKNFIIAATRELTAGQPLLDKAEKAENFFQVLNVRNPLTTYNLRFTPAKNLVRWFKTLNIGLISYLSELIRFASGEGNTEAITKDNIYQCDGGYWTTEVRENGNFDTRLATVSEKTPLFEPMFREVDYPLTWEQYKTLRASPYGYIKVSGTEIHVMQVVYSFNGNSKILGVKRWA